MRATNRGLAVLAVALAAAGCAAPTPTPGPTPTPLSQVVLGPFAFSAPTSWTVVATGNPAHYETLYGFVAAPPATATETCGPNYIPGLGACDDTLTVPSGSVVVSFRQFVNGACHPTAAGQLAQDEAAGWTPTQVSGLTSAVDRPVLGESGATWTWHLAGPGADGCELDEVKARFGDKSTALGAAVDALAASLEVSAPAP